MILLTFESDGEERLGIKTTYGVLDVAAAGEALGIAGAPTSVGALLAGGTRARQALETLAARAREAADKKAAWLVEESSLRLLPCVPAPGKIVCIGLNYRRHAAESGLEPPATPVVFSKFENALAAAGEPIPLPRVAEQYDYEAELVAVIGHEARDVSEDEALDYVFGYANGNDLSARDLQTRTSQWLLGKTLDKFLPLGPYLVSADEAGDPQSFAIRCWVNGELRQNSNTADMIFSVAEIVSYLSRHMTLKPGDIISTGTPEGVVLGMAEKVWLRPGDTVTVEIEGLGRLTNEMRGEGRS